jgi:hypothetical protein
MPRLLRLHWAVAGALCLAGVGSAAANDAAPRPAVVELFTSEGCNSCPPAEAYVGELARRNDVLPLAFHVDYWDDQGWRDRFGLPQSVERQRNYAQTLRVPTVYTPQVVIDGHGDYLGSDRNAIGAALKTSRAGVPVTLTVDSAEVRVKLESQSARLPANDVLLVTYLRKTVSAIGRGENAGRTLDEYNIVRSFKMLGRWDGSAREFHIERASLPQDATDVAILVQSPGQGPIIGATTHPLAAS